MRLEAICNVNNDSVWKFDSTEWLLFFLGFFFCYMWLRCLGIARYSWLVTKSLPSDFFFNSGCRQTCLCLSISLALSFCSPKSHGACSVHELLWFPQFPVVYVWFKVVSHAVIFGSECKDKRISPIPFPLPHWSVWRKCITDEESWGDARLPPLSLKPFTTSSISRF